MDSVSGRRSLSVEEVGEALAFLRDRHAPSGALLLAVEGPATVVWANASSADLLDGTTAETLSRRLFADGRFEAAIGRLADNRDEHFERLRIARGLRSRTVTVALSRLRLSSGRPITAIAVPDSDANASTSAWDTSILAEDLSEASDDIAPPVVPDVTASPVISQPTPANRESPDRFLWRTDAQSRLLLIESAPELVQRLEGDLTGLSLPDVFSERGCDPDGLLVNAFAGRATWSGLRLTWPVAQDGSAPEVVLGAVPIFGPLRNFEGYRGFGTIALMRGVTFLAEQSPASIPKRDAASADGAPEPANDHGPAEKSSEQERLEDVVAPQATAEDGPVSDGPRVMAADQYSSKVVMLRPYQAVAPLSGAAVLSDSARLSATERSAFEEIGLALGGLVAEQPVARHGGTAWDGAVIDSLPMAIWYEEEGSPARSNRAFAGLTGYASAEDLRSAGGIVHLLGGADLPLPVDGADRVFSILDAQGRAVSVEGHGAVGGPDGRKTTLLVFRRAPQVRNDTMADLAGDGLALLDPNGTLRHVNRAAEHLFGRSQEDLTGQDLGALLLPEDRAEVAALLAGLAARTDGQAATARVRLRRTNGTVLRLLLNGRRLGSGTLGVTLRDETAAETLERAHAAALDQVAQLKQSKADFLTRVSHDVRTPLNGILGFAEVILDERFGPIGNPRYRDYLLDIHQSGAHVLAVISDLLDLSKMEAGRFDVSVAAVDVNRIVADCVTQMQPDAHRERVIMRTSLLPRLPFALVDERALQQMMTNVLSNAVKFNEPGGQVIVSTALNDAGAIAVRVRDTGIGMSEAEVAAATEPFRQVATLDAGGGSGLGLPLTKALAEANGATVAISSQKQEGTLIEIMLRADPEQPMRVPAA